MKASDAFDALTTELKGTTLAMQAIGATRRLDLSALGDAQFLQRYGNEKDARDAILTRLNNVDGIYSSQLAIEIRVGTLSVPDADHDQLSAATDPKGLLRELANLRKRSADLNSQGSRTCSPIATSTAPRSASRTSTRCATARTPSVYRIAQRLAGLAGRGARDGPQLRR